MELVGAINRARLWHGRRVLINSAVLAEQAEAHARQMWPKPLGEEDVEKTSQRERKECSGFKRYGEIVCLCDPAGDVGLVKSLVKDKEMSVIVLDPNWTHIGSARVFDMVVVAFGGPRLSLVREIFSYFKRKK
jgi:uncharacterized protein YkwD